MRPAQKLAHVPARIKILSHNRSCWLLSGSADPDRNRAQALLFGHLAFPTRCLVGDFRVLLVEHARRGIASRAAASGNMRRDPKGLTGAARRLLREPTAVGLATEFAGHWLNFRQFKAHDGVDRTHTVPALRRRLAPGNVRRAGPLLPRRGPAHDRPVGRVPRRPGTPSSNRALARHYGTPEPARTGPDDWVRVDNATVRPRRPLADGRLPHAERAGPADEPVKRGYWVVRRLLGEASRSPARERARLPDDEAKLGDRDLTRNARPTPSRQGLTGATEGSTGSASPSRGTAVRRGADRRPRRPPRRHHAALPWRRRRVGVEGLRVYLLERLARSSSTTLAGSCWRTAWVGALLPSDDATVDAHANEGH